MLSPGYVSSGGTFTATVSGVSNCDGRMAYFFRQDQPLNTLGSCMVSGGGCSKTLTAPSGVGAYTYLGGIDKNRNAHILDSGESATAQLTVSVPTSSSCAPTVAADGSTPRGTVICWNNPALGKKNFGIIQGSLVGTCVENKFTNAYTVQLFDSARNSHFETLTDFSHMTIGIGECQETAPNSAGSASANPQTESAGTQGASAVPAGYVEYTRSPIVCTNTHSAGQKVCYQNYMWFCKSGGKWYYKECSGGCSAGAPDCNA